MNYVFIMKWNKNVEYKKNFNLKAFIFFFNLDEEAN